MASQNYSRIEKRMVKYNQTDYNNLGYVHPVNELMSGWVGGWALILDDGSTVFGWNIKEMIENIDKRFAT